MTSFINALPGAISQGMIWGIMAIGLYITYRVLEVSDLTVDGSFCTGGCVCVTMIVGGCNVWVAMLGAILAGMVTGLVTGFFHTKCGIPAILAGILTQLGLWSVNLAILGMKANQAININNYKLLVSLRYLQDVSKGTRPFYNHPIFAVGMVTVVVIAILYWFFGTDPRHRRQSEYGPGAGYQHQPQHRVRPCAGQWTGSTGRRFAEPV